MISTVIDVQTLGLMKKWGIEELRLSSVRGVHDVLSLSSLTVSECVFVDTTTALNTCRDISDFSLYGLNSSVMSDNNLLSVLHVSVRSVDTQYTSGSTQFGHMSSICSVHVFDHVIPCCVTVTPSCMVGWRVSMF